MGTLRSFLQFGACMAERVFQVEDMIYNMFVGNNTVAPSKPYMRHWSASFKALEY